MVSKLTSRFVAQSCRMALFLVVAAGISPFLQSRTGYAQDASEATILDSKASAVQNSITGASSSSIQDNGDQTIDVKSFGAVGDGVANDTEAFNAALASLATAGGGKCLVPKGTYLISGAKNPAITSHVSSNVHLVGAGRGASILRIAGVPAGNFLFCSGDNWSLEDLTIDMQDYFIHFPGFAAVVATGNNWRITNCAVIKIGHRGINMKGGANGYITKCLITKTEASPLDNSAMLGVVDGEGHLPVNMHIIDDVCVNSLIYFNGKDSVIARNRVSGSRFGTNICTGVHSDNVTVINNTCSGGRGRDQCNSYVSGLELWATNSVIANNTSYDNDGAGITMGGNNCIVVGNRCWNNAGLSGVVGGSGIVGRAHATFPNAATGSVFIGNSSFDTRPRGAMTQAYGYNEVGNGLRNIVHFGNDFEHNKNGSVRSKSLFGHVNILKVRTNDAGSAISPAVKNKLKALAADDKGMSDFARRALHKYLEQ